MKDGQAVGYYGPGQLEHLEGRPSVPGHGLMPHHQTSMPSQPTPVEPFTHPQGLPSSFLNHFSNFADPPTGTDISQPQSYTEIPQLPSQGGLTWAPGFTGSPNSAGNFLGANLGQNPPPDPHSQQQPLGAAMDPPGGLPHFPASSLGTIPGRYPPFHLPGHPHSQWGPRGAAMDPPGDLPHFPASSLKTNPGRYPPSHPLGQLLSQVRVMSTPQFTGGPVTMPISAQDPVSNPMGPGQGVHSDPDPDDPDIPVPTNEVPDPGKCLATWPLFTQEFC